jgi:hypothetical protein
MKVASHCYPVRASNSAVNVWHAVSHLAVPKDLKRLAEISDYVLAFIVSGHRANAASIDRPNDGDDRPIVTSASARRLVATSITSAPDGTSIISTAYPFG